MSLYSRAHNIWLKQADMPSLSVDIMAKWGKFWETSKKLAGILMFLSPLNMSPFHKTKVLQNNLKDSINTLGIKYWISNPAYIIGQISGTCALLKHEHWRKRMIIVEKYWLPKTDMATKSSPYGGNRAISLKPERKSHPLCLVWWVLILYNFYNVSFWKTI